MPFEQGTLARRSKNPVSQQGKTELVKATKFSWENRGTEWRVRVCWELLHLSGLLYNRWSQTASRGYEVTEKEGTREEPVFLWPQVAGIMVRPYGVWFYFLVTSFFISVFLHPCLPSLTLTQVTNFELWWISNSTWLPNVYLHQQSEATSILVLAGYTHQQHL